jgi:hypothetical protein
VPDWEVGGKYQNMSEATPTPAIFLEPSGRFT